MMEREVGCEGCGVLLQTEYPEKPGYVPLTALEREHPICRRCFRIRHYNEVAPVEQDPDVYLSMLGEIGNRKALVVQVVDLFDLSGSWIPGIQRHTGGNPILILGNKLDLFPKSAKVQRLKEWVVHTVGELGVQPVDVVLTSAAKGYHFDEVVRAIETHREGQDVFVTGTANVGKSTLINRLLKEFGSGEEVITTSPYPGTTLDTIHIPLEGERELVDMPGIVRRDRMSEWVEPEELSEITPKSEIKPKVYQLNDGQTLFFGGLARMDYSEGSTPALCLLHGQLLLYSPHQTGQGR